MKKINLEIIIPVIIAIIVVAVFVYLDYRNKASQPETPIKEDETEVYKPKPIPRSENPRRGELLDPRLGCAGPQHIKPPLLKEPDGEWLIRKDGEITTVSLGKYKITAPVNLVFDIPKLWLYFFSETLSDREDGLYGLEQSYTSRIILMVNGYEREVRLGGDEYMFIELSDYPLGDLYPYDREAILEFEFLIELKCKNLEDGTCLDNSGKPLDYINNTDIKTQIRIFARGCEEFTNDIVTDGKFRYGE